MAASALFALILGIPTLRLRGDYLAIVTIAAAEVVRLLFLTTAFDPVTGSADGLSGYHESFRAANPIPDGTYGFGPWTYNANDWWVRILGVIALAIAVFVVWRLITSPWGRVLKGIREDEDAVRSLGKNVFQYKMQALVVGGCIGAMRRHRLRTPLRGSSPRATRLRSPSSSDDPPAGRARPTVFGPTLGAVIFWVVIAFPRQSTSPNSRDAGILPMSVDFRRALCATILVGVALMVLVIFRPQGISATSGDRPLSSNGTSEKTARRSTAPPRRPGHDRQRSLAEDRRTREGEAAPGVAKDDPILIADGVRRTFGGLTAVDVEHVEIPRGGRSRP
jgi:branched-chain amino acid transport system permease protein